MNKERPTNAGESRVTIQDLEAYLNGTLDQENMERVERHLLLDPHLAEQIRFDGMMRRCLRRMFAPTLNDPIPPPLRTILDRGLDRDLDRDKGRR